jgi:hypothetical protein
MKAYSASGNVSMSSAPKTIIAMLNTATRRGKLLQVIVGCSGTPADAAALFAIRKLTADGTAAGAGNVFQADSADGAPLVTTKVGYTAEPTYSTGNLAEIALHQRNTAVWNVPSLDASPAAALGTANGIGIQLVSGPTGVNYNVTLVWDE